MDLQGGIFDNFKGLIKVIDELRDCGIEQDVKLPKIVVFGTQSSGKSSLLEQIVGLDFLPRGMGVVTRVPLEIRLQHHSSQLDQQFLPYAYFFEETEKKYTNFNEDVKKRIEQITEEKAGKNKGIVDELITLTIVSSTCPNLTLIDLPGITKNPCVGSDQTHEIEKITKALATKYIQDEMSIILCVIPINQDLQNSDALQMAHQFDPDGSRTFGVLTKIDIMDHGTNCIDALTNNECKLKHGFIGVKCRSQKDIISRKTVQESLEEEEMYFQNHAQYSTLIGLTGTQTLSNKLSQLLQQHIKENLPTIMKNINQSIYFKESKLRTLGDPIPPDDGSKIMIIISKMQHISQLFNDILANKMQQNVELPKLLKRTPNGGHRILIQFRDYSNKMNDISKQILQEYTLDLIGEDLNLYAKPILGFLPFEAFQQKLNSCMHVYEEPSIKLLKDITDYLNEVLVFCIEEHTPSHGRLREELRSLIMLQFKQCKVKTKQLIREIIESEKVAPFEPLDSSKVNLDSYKKNIVFQGKRTIYQEIMSLDFSEKNIYSITSLANKLYNDSFKHPTAEIQYSQPASNIQQANKQPVQVCTKQFSGGLFGDRDQVAAPISPAIAKPVLKEVEIGISNSKDDILQFAFKFFNYLSNIEKQLSQQIPKMIQCFFIQSFSNNVLRSAINTINKNPSITKVYEETEENIQFRLRLNKSLSQLNKAKSNLTKLCSKVRLSVDFER